MKSASHIHRERILVRSVNWLGDAVMTTPALLRLREACPDAYIAIFTADKLKDLWHGHPAIDEVIAFSAKETLLSASRRLGRQKFTDALVLPNSPRSALEVFVAGIPRRIGYARQGRGWLLTQAVAPRPDSVPMHKRTTAEIRQLIANSAAEPPAPPPAKAHQIYEYLHLTAALGANPQPLAPVLTAVPFAKTGLAKFFAPGSQRAKHLIGLNPAAEYGPAKRWPTEFFAAAAIKLYRRLNCEFLIFGGPADLKLTEQLRAQLHAPLAHGHVTALAGKTSLGELMSAIKACRVVITNDTGPMHLAAALGTPVVVPFGSTSPELTGPGLPGDSRHRLLKSTAPCSPCFRRDCPIDLRCLRGISVESVVKAAIDAFGGSPDSPARQR